MRKRLEVLKYKTDLDGYQFVCSLHSGLAIHPCDLHIIEQSFPVGKSIPNIGSDSPSLRGLVLKDLFGNVPDDVNAILVEKSKGGYVARYCILDYKQISERNRDGEVYTLGGRT